MRIVVKGGREDDRCLLATKVAVQIQLKALYMEVSGRTSSLLQYSCMTSKLLLVVRHYTCYRSTTNNKLSSRKFWYSLMVSNPLISVSVFWQSSVTLWHTQLSYAWSALTQYKGHLQLKRSTAERHINITLLCPMYNLQAVELIHRSMGWNSCKAWCRKPWYPPSLFYGYSHFC